MKLHILISVNKGRKFLLCLMVEKEKKYFINLLLSEICQKRIIYIVFHQVLLQLSWRCAHAAFTLYYRCK